MRNKVNRWYQGKKNPTIQKKSKIMINRVSWIKGYGEMVELKKFLINC